MRRVFGALESWAGVAHQDGGPGSAPERADEESVASRRGSLGGRAQGVFVLEDGAKVRVRALRSSDETALRTGFAAFSSESRHPRHRSRVFALSGSTWRYWCQVDSRERFALAALTPDGRRIVGVARFARSSKKRALAEISMMIADDWQRRGLGTRLMEELAGHARGVGVTTFVAHALASNSGIRRVMAKAGSVTESRAGAESIHVVALGEPRWVHGGP